MKELRVATLGAEFSANKGAASMLQAVIDNLPGRVGPCRFEVLSKYPEQDEADNPNDAVAIVPARPAAFPLMFVLALLARLGAAVGLPRRVFCLLPALRALDRADVLVDIAGISFVDGRGLPILGYNFLMTSVPILLGVPVVKLAQAMGPFHRPLNRLLARWVLSRTRRVCARGVSTAEHLRELGLDNAELVADLAFTLTTTPEAESRAAALLAGSRPPRVAVVPSAVVQLYCQKTAIDYPELMARFIDRLIDQLAVDVFVFPHAARPQAPASRMNDLPLCRTIAERVERRDRCHLIAESLPPAVLRALVASADALVTSRFHAMISALATATPVVVVAWSHKYLEVLQEFGLEESTMDYSELTVERLLDRCRAVYESRQEIAHRIRAALPQSVERSRQNYEVLASVLEAAE